MAGVEVVIVLGGGGNLRDPRPVVAAVTGGPAESAAAIEAGIVQD
jgi:hypothetical protein